MASKSRGDLVYIPASVTLYQFDDKWDNNSNNAGIWAPTGAGAVKKYKKTSKPMNVLCVGSGSNGYKQIIYESEKWMVREKDIYAARRGE